MVLEDPYNSLASQEGAGLWGCITFVDGLYWDAYDDLGSGDTLAHSVDCPCILRSSLSSETIEVQPEDSR